MAARGAPTYDLGTMPILLLFVQVGRAGCLDLPIELGTAERAIVDTRLDDANRSLQRIEVELGAAPGSRNAGCSRLDPATVARFWIAEGAAASLGGSAEGAFRAFHAAARVAPGQWTVAFGSTLRAEWEAAAALPDAIGRIALDPGPVGRAAWLDGNQAVFPIDVADGLHLVQVGTDDEAVWGAIVLVPAAETFVVRLPDLPPLPVAWDPIEPSVMPTAPADHARVRKTVFLAGGAACLVAGGATAWLAERKDDDLADADDLHELDAAHHSQQTLGALSYSLLGVGAAGIVVGLAW
jgi:hypothetical protein